MVSLSQETFLSRFLWKNSSTDHHTSYKKLGRQGTSCAGRIAASTTPHHKGSDGAVLVSRFPQWGPKSASSFPHVIPDTHGFSLDDYIAGGALQFTNPGVSPITLQAWISEDLARQLRETEVTEGS
jgi:hypothetical protein